MTTYEDLGDFFKQQGYKVIIAADAQTRVSVPTKDGIMTKVPAGGVAVALDPVAKASNAIYIARGRTEEDRKVLDRNGKIAIKDADGAYTLKRLFFSEEDVDNYYNGFSNQTLWPMCHVTFEQPLFEPEWYKSFVKVNKKFAESIQEEINGKTFIWINDYQLSLVPKFLGKQKNVVVGMFWHIPWPTWEVFRILPWKKDILESLLMVNFLGFHRGYQVRNFLETVRTEFEVRIDEETSRVFFNNNQTTVKNLPMGIDVDVIRSISQQEEEESFLSRLIKNLLQPEEKADESQKSLSTIFDKHKVILGVDRLDYTKGLLLRLHALDRFFEKYKEYQGKVIYLGILAPSRENIPSYKILKKEVRDLAHEINKKYAMKGWLPICLIHDTFSRTQVMTFYQKADICLVTPRDDGMNLVSKEFVVAASLAKDPGMLVLSKFAGSAIDLTQSLIINPYDIDEVATAIRKGLEMEKNEKIRRIKEMTQTLEERNVYQWSQDFVRNTITAPTS